MLRAMLVLLSFFVLQPSTQAIEIVDRLWQFERLERSLPPVSFETAFDCQKTATFQLAREMCTLACEPYGRMTMCHSVCIPPDIRSNWVEESVLSCSSDEVVTVLSDGEIRRVGRSDFTRFQGNPLRELFERVPNWLKGAYRFEILQVVPAVHTLGWKTENERQVSAFNVDGEVFLNIPSGQEESFRFIATLIDDPSIPWSLRAARFRIIDEGTVWRLHDL
jgi:hypothetical protein